MSSKHVLVIGAGPAGLTAALTILENGGSGIDVTIVEADPHYVGGLSRTVEYKGFSFDIGGHRFFSKSKAIEALWSRILGEDMLVRPRLSRIYYRGQFYSYPLKAGDALTKLGLLESAACGFSFLKARLTRLRNIGSYEDWVTNRFGRRLFEIFFKTYTEKVWGMKCTEISADWAAQRIKDLTLATAVKNALGMAGRGNGTPVTSLINSFRYPRKGPGMMWQRVTERVISMGGQVRMGEKVTSCKWEVDKQKWFVTTVAITGKEQQIECDEIISSAPLRSMVRDLHPSLSQESLDAAAALRYRDFILVALIVSGEDLFPDNWIYIHDPEVKVGRIQNFRSWSPEMVPDPAFACIGMEYFCFEGDGLWAASDQDLTALASAELEKLGLASRDKVVESHVVRQRKAYPVYDNEYAANVEVIRRELEKRFPTLHLVGRNGMHKYNNQDHAMMTGILAAENIIAGERLHDVWRVNQDAEYHEEHSTSGERLSPKRL